LLDTPLIGREAWPYFEVLYRIVKKSNSRRVTTWPSKEQAMAWFETRPPWKEFHKDVLDIVQVRRAFILWALPAMEYGIDGRNVGHVLHA
jgi:hypothetical protein